MHIARVSRPTLNARTREHLSPMTHDKLILFLFFRYFLYIAYFYWCIKKFIYNEQNIKLYKCSSHK